VTRAVLLRVGATAATVLGLLASAGYVAANPKNVAAPLQPPVVRPSPTVPPAARPTGRIQVAPAVRATDLPAVTQTHIS
jgi:hypothetical protein